MKVSIKNRLNERGMTQREIGKMLGISAQQMSRAVAGASGPRDIEIREQIYKILGMDEKEV
ncbi:helix-turn-helix domain-containing protein [Lacticaseibacillus sharpeae]|uniref:helix-turn-helix domain-containing protein n=1 Tax=Lacticaseibacillus sharpeae TaxID=1626 RepID=UPI00138F1C24|nr:helix-turn-helix transcriptional regulator [Lacticaseibacillus sharpeae]